MMLGTLKGRSIIISFGKGGKCSLEKQLLVPVNVGQWEIRDWNLILDSNDLSTKSLESSFTLTPVASWWLWRVPLRRKGNFRVHKCLFLAKDYLRMDIPSASHCTVHQIFHVLPGNLGIMQPELANRLPAEIKKRKTSFCCVKSLRLWKYFSYCGITHLVRFYVPANSAKVTLEKLSACRQDNISPKG